MRVCSSFLFASCLGILSACTLLVEVQDPPSNNANNTNNTNNTNNANNTNNTNNSNNGVCGDGLVTGGESCDEENLNGQTCLTLGYVGGWLHCDATCNFDTSECSDAPICGDGLRADTEACDGDDFDGATCQSLGMGFTGGTLQCITCMIDTGACTSGETEICDNEIDDDANGLIDCDDPECATFPMCTGENCGDGQIEGNEECDDSDLNGQTCTSFGFSGGMLLCDPFFCRFDFSTCTATQLTNVRKVVTGQTHSCALTMDGLVFCWGENGNYMLGQPDSTYAFYPTPVQVPELDYPVEDLAAGHTHTCVIMPTGNNSEKAVYCWGYNGFGQAGVNPSGGSFWTPTQVIGVDYPVAVVAGAYHTCARQAGGTMYCWGDNSMGQLGVPGITDYTATPQVVGSLTNLLQISAGHSNTCAITMSNEVYCWGQNHLGQVGNNTTTEARSPTRVYDSFLASYISTGGSHTCAIGSGSFTGVYCWGSNSHGQLGQDLTTTSASLIPISIPGFTANYLEAGWGLTCAGTSTALYCWGLNDQGQLGINSTVSPVPNPTEVPIATDTVTSVDLDSMHTCAVTASKQVLCWGYNYFGQLGNANRMDTLGPVPVGN